MGKHKELSSEDRDQIAVLFAKEISRHKIAKQLNRAVSTISEEIKRNGFSRGIYHASAAQKRAHKRKSEASQNRYPLKSQKIYSFVIEKLREGLSPEQISGQLKFKHPQDKTWHVGVETIYQFLYAPENKEKQLWEYLPRKRKKRRKKTGRAVRRNHIPQRVSIRLRPEAINERKEFGHWEGDTVEGIGHRNGIHTEVERVSRFIQAVKVSAINSEQGITAQIKIFGGQPACARKSTTLDNGRENHRHHELQQFQMKTYFADPYCSWQRGTNENSNGLIRRYFPKGTDFEKVSDDDLQEVLDELNSRPRKCLGFRSSQEVYDSLVLQTAGCSDST